MPRSLPLWLELLLTFVGVIAATTGVLTVSAYRSSRATLETEARRRVRVAAENREQTLERLLASQQQRARGFLSGLDSICGEPGRAGAVTWEIGCVRTALEEYRATERAIGAALTAGGRRIAVTGTYQIVGTAVPGTLAEVVARGGAIDYVMSTTGGPAVLTVRYSMDLFRADFEDRSGLGDAGEVFLTAADGTFLTPARYSASPTPPGAALTEPAAECSGGPGERIDIDYRGQLTVHGFRPVPPLIGAGCVDAHLPYTDAMAPAEDLRTRLVARGAIFMAAGALLSILAALWIALPVRRLAVSARAIQAGAFDRDVRVSGPSEVQALARAFNASARAIAQLVAREQAARRDAESANRAKDEFLATVSHELRTPLTAMLGWANLLRTGRLDAAGAAHAAAAIERSAEAQARLIEDLLDISRIVAGRLRLRRTGVALTAPVDAAVEAVRPLAQERHVTVETTYTASPVNVFGDPQRLQQIAWNLLTNAVKFTDAGGRVSVRIRVANGRAELTVADTGVGIAPEFLPHMFERFRQADAATTRRHSGLGLGLAIVRFLTKAHGGDVTVASEGEGRGATFTVTLPLYDGPVSAPRKPDTDRTTPRPLASTPVLLVDDDVDTLDVVRAMLEDAGAEVTTATSAEEARSAMAIHAPAVLISDLGMPGEDGYSLVRSLRARGNPVPAIALTAYVRREDAEEAHAAGFQLHMAKPVEAHELIDAVASLATSRGGNPEEKSPAG